MFYALIGDIIDSKKLHNRKKVQEELNDCLTTLNSEFAYNIAKELSITLGDEFQGLFHSFNHIFEIIHKIEFHMYPTKLRFGIGVGEVEFDFGNGYSPYQSDGSVWWNARDAINLVKNCKSKNKQEEFSNIYVKSDNDFLSEFINHTLDMCYSIRINWTEKQRELIKYTIKNYGLNSSFVIKDVAITTNQSNSTVFQKYKTSRYLNYVKVLASITNLLQSRSESNDV